MITLLLAAVLAQSAPTAAKLDCAQPRNTVESNECAAEALARDRDQMSKYLDAALVRLIADSEEDGGQKFGDLTDQVVASQQAFENYLEKACQAVQTRWQSGSIRTVMALGCQRRLVQERTLHLWREYLTFMDSTPPLLPEPKPHVWVEPVSDRSEGAISAAVAAEPADAANLTPSPEPAPTPAPSPDPAREAGETGPAKATPTAPASRSTPTGAAAPSTS